MPKTTLPFKGATTVVFYIYNGTKTNIVRKELLPALFIFFSMVATAQPGMLDETFGDAGIASTQPATSCDYSDMVIQPDHKILCVGAQLNGLFQAALVRYNYNGSPDSSFGTNGIAYSSLFPDEVRLNAIALQPDGKIVVAGYYHSGINNYDFITARYNTDGSLDAGFNGTGVVTTHLTDFPDFAHAVAIQPDGKILVSGYMFNGHHSVFAVVRYTANGLPDSTFDDDGIESIDVATLHSLSFYMTLQPDDKIVLAGRSNDIDSLENFAVVRLLKDGAPDSSFGGDGIVTIDNAGLRDEVLYITVMPDGKLLACGKSENAGGPQLLRGVLFRLTDNGTLDSSFADNGFAMFGLDNGYDIFQALALQNDGKIVVAGTTFNGTDNDFILLRYKSNGSADNSFDGDGLVITPVATGPSNAGAVKLDGNRIYLAGFATAPNGFLMGAVAAYQNDGGPLPLRLLNFSGIAKAQTVYISWQTAFEENILHFTIQRSTDGKNFKNIGTVGAFNHATGSAYSFNDLYHTDGQLFYRLQITEHNGNVYYSDIITIAPQDKKKGLQLFPNPLVNDLTVRANGLSGVALIRVMDSNGKTVIETKQVLNGNIPFTMPVKYLMPGAYTLLLSTAAGKLQRQFIKL